MALVGIFDWVPAFAGMTGLRAVNADRPCKATLFDRKATLLALKATLLTRKATVLPTKATVSGNFAPDRVNVSTPGANRCR